MFSNSPPFQPGPNHAQATPPLNQLRVKHGGWKDGVQRDSSLNSLQTEYLPFANLIKNIQPREHPRSLETVFAERVPED